MTAQDISIIFLFFLVAWVVFQDRKREESIAIMWRVHALKFSNEIRIIFVSLNQLMSYEDYESTLQAAKRFSTAGKMATLEAQWIDGGNEVDEAINKTFISSDRVIESMLQLRF